MPAPPSFVNAPASTCLLFCAFAWPVTSTSTLNNANIYSYNVTSFAPNGDILAANDSVNGNWTYSYDPFNRLVGSNKNSGQAVYSYVYDRFGNRWQQNGPNSMQLTFTGNNPNSPQNNNRMDGYTYDAAGNLLNDGTHQYFYDAENRLVQVDGTLPDCSSNGASGSTATACYFYDANGHRVRSTGVNCYGSGISGGVGYIYDLSGRWISTFAMSTTGGGAPCQYEVFAGSRHLGQGGGAAIYSHLDWLGTERVRTQSGSVCESTSSSPFGDGQTTTGTCYNSSRLHFTGKERDYESGLDNFGARYNSSSFGRFMSPDEPLTYQRKEQPQSWNLYSYVQNNPTTTVDPDGHDCVYLNNAGNGVESIDHNSNSGECRSHGGFWANGTVEANWWVKTDANSDIVHIWSHYKNIVGETWAGPGWSHGDKYADVIPQVQARDESLDYQLRMWGALAVMHGPGGLPGEGDTGSPVEDLPRTGSALKKDLYHAFPDEVDNSAGAGTTTQLRPGVTLYQVEGSYRGVEGRFEWIVDNGNVTHRMFVPGGTASGIPIKP